MSAELALQGAFVSTLKSDLGVTSGIAGRVYDRVPANAALPYVHLRSFQGVADGADCVDGLELYADVDVWSNAVGKPEAARIAESVRRALDGHLLALDAPWALIDLEHRNTIIGDEDDLLVRARISFRALVERA